MNERIFVALDVETTGLQAGVDEIIEFAAVKFRAGEILERYSQLISPYQPLPIKITRLTGIKAEDLVAAPRFNAVGAKIAGFIKSYPIVGHSINFDLSMLRAQGMNFSQPIYDTFELATMLMPQIPVYKLSKIAEYLAIPHPADHRALNDAEVTAHVFTYLLNHIQQMDLDNLREINRLIARTLFPMRDLFEEALRTQSRSPFTSPAPQRARDSFPSYPEAHPTLHPTGDKRPLDLDAITQFFAADGALGQAFSGYELRQPQAAMARAVAQAFNQSDPLIVEAGTGTGKSWAYLVPATKFAIQRGERVVVSTNTINLQDQLFFKDIPDLQRIMAPDAPSDAPPFTAALLKGRSNYLCLKRYHELRRYENLTPEEVRTLLKIQLWLPTTSSGDKSELLLMEREHSAWGRVNVTPETCIGARCSHFAECYFFQARRKAEAAHILVVNHALLIADITTESKVLPPYSHIIVDEAHNLEDVATDQLSFSTDQAELLKFFDNIFQEGGVQVVSGLLADLPQYMSATGVESAKQDKAWQIIELLKSALVRARVTVYECFKQLANFMAQESEGGQYDSRLRLTPGVRAKPEWIEIQASWQYFSENLTIIGDSLAKLEAFLLELEADTAAGYNELVLQATFLTRFALEVRVQTGYIIGGHAETISWLNQDRLNNTLALFAAPLSVTAILEAQLFAQKETAVLTSATLTIEGNFNFIRDRIGLPEPEELMLESPFNYEEQALVYIPNDIPEPNQRGYQQSIEEAIRDLSTASGGRTLALFTANSTLKQTYAAIQESLEAQEIALLGQGIDGSRRSLLDRFKEFPRTVLLGTSSFWEGVDVVGDALSVLVITKLPFAVPTDPIYAARSETFSDPFGEYSIPLSILKFKQGFGRLIRSHNDRGIVVILDKRLISKKYGQKFLDSLPATRVRTGPLKQLPALASKFLGGEGR